MRTTYKSYCGAGRQRIGIHYSTGHNPFSDKLCKNYNIYHTHHMKSGTSRPCRNHQACVRDMYEKTKHNFKEMHLYQSWTGVQIKPMLKKLATPMPITQCVYKCKFLIWTPGTIINPEATQHNWKLKATANTLKAPF